MSFIKTSIKKLHSFSILILQLIFIIFYFYKNKKHLSKGKYILHNNFRTLFNNNHKLNISVEGNLNNKIKKILLFLLNHSPIFIKFRKKSLFNANIMYLNNTNKLKRNIKLFSEAKKEVLVFSSPKDYIFHKENYDYISSNFPTSQCYNFDDKDFSYTEKFIQTKNNSNWSNDDIISIYKNIINHYSKYFQSQKTENQLHNYNLLIDEKIHESKILQNYLNELNLKSSAVPFYYQHGDLSFYNILFDTKNCYWIDWEHFGLYPFYIDLYFPVIHQIMIENNDLLIKELLKGTFDKEFDKIFSELKVNKNHMFWTRLTFVHMLERIYNNFNNIPLIEGYLIKFLEKISNI